MIDVDWEQNLEMIQTCCVSEATEELSLDDSAQMKEADNVNGEEDMFHSATSAEPVNNHSDEPSSSGEPPRLSVSELSVSPPIPKSHTVPEVTPAAKPRSAAKVDALFVSFLDVLLVLPSVYYVHSWFDVQLTSINWEL